MNESWQQAFDRLEASGVTFCNVEAGRGFALGALREISRPVPDVVQAAMSVSEQLQAGAARSEDVLKTRSRCWEYERANLAPGVAPHEDPEIAALRLAIGATEESVGPEPWFWVRMTATLAVAAGVSTEAVAGLLKKQYATNGAA